MQNNQLKPLTAAQLKQVSGGKKVGKRPPTPAPTKAGYGSIN